MTENGNGRKGKAGSSRRDDLVPTSPSPKSAGFREHIAEIIEETPNAGTTGADFPEEVEKWEAQNRAERLRQAVRLAGGNRAVSERSGVPYATLNAYIAGGEMKVSRAIALADATGVSLEWLLTGRGPMRPGEAPADAPRPAMGDYLPCGLDEIDMAGLVFGLEFADRMHGRHGDPAQRVDTMLAAQAAVREQNRLPPLRPFDRDTLVAALAFVDRTDKPEDSPRERLQILFMAYGLVAGEEAPPAKPQETAIKTNKEGT